MKEVSSTQDLFVFLVEPSRAQAQVITAQLEKFGILRIQHFAEAGKALEAMAGDDKPDLVISAMYLPDMTGTDLIGKMRATRALSEIAFILISSETRPHVLDPVRQSGASAILPKPFAPEQLRTALRATLDYLNPGSVKLDDWHADIDSLRVLVVDDSRSARAFIRRVLTNLGIREDNMTEAENGVQAVAALQSSFFDLVVTDYNMPEMDGQQLVEYIRRQSWQSSVPVLMVTSEQDQGRLAAVEQAGVSALCDKPFEPHMVKALLDKILADAAQERA